MPIGTPVHDRTFALCESLNYREWSGYYAVSVYEGHHEHEYNAIRNASALIDVSPLYKYRIDGRDAARFVDRIITRDVTKMSVGQVFYTPWCDEHGKVIDDGTVARLAEQTFRWTAADPSLRWFRQNASGLDVVIDDISEETAALALQGPTSAKLLRAVAEADLDRLKYFRVTQADHRRRDGGHLAHRLYRRSRLRNLDAGAAGGARVGRPDGTRPAVRHQAGRDARARRRAHRSGVAADRGRLREQQEGDDRAAGLHAVRDGPRAARQSRQGPLRRPAGAPRRAARAATPVRLSVSRSSGPASSGSTRSWGCRRPSRRPRRASRFRSTDRAGRSGKRPRRRGRRC